MTIQFEDFAKLDIRIGTIESVERVPNGDKLLKLIFDIGTEKRQIMAGIAEFVDNPQELIGKQLPLLLNIPPRSFRGHESHGMIVAADHNHQPVFLIPETSVPNGSKVR